MAPKARSTMIQGLIGTGEHIRIPNSDTPCEKLPSPCMSAWGLVSLVAPSFQPMGKYLATSIHREKSNSQQNVWYLGRVEVQTISNSGDSPTYPAAPHISFKQYDLIKSGDSPTCPAAPHSPFKQYNLVKSGDSPTYPSEPYRAPDCSFEQNSDAEFRRLHYTSITNVGPVRASDRSRSASDVQIAIHL